MELLNLSDLDGFFDVTYENMSIKFKALRDVSGKLEFNIPISTAYTSITPAPKSIWPEDFLNVNTSNFVAAGTSIP